MRQQMLGLEGQLEESHENSERLSNSLDSYKQKYDSSLEDLRHLETKYSAIQEALAETRNRVGLQ